MRDNRMESLSVTPTEQRQTPKVDFGDVMSKVADKAFKVTAAVASTAATGNPATLFNAFREAASPIQAEGPRHPVQGLSAQRAISAGTTAVGGGASTVGHSATPPVGNGGGAGHSSEPVLSAAVATGGASAGGATGSPPSTGDSNADLTALQAKMQKESQSFQVQYIELQNEMQQESRTYNTISNVLKTRHDSAKSAINNIR